MDMLTYYGANIKLQWGGTFFQQDITITVKYIHVSAFETSTLGGFRLKYSKFDVT